MSSVALFIATAVLLPVVVSAAITGVGLFAERAHPAGSRPVGGVIFNLFYLLPLKLLHEASLPLVAAAVVAITNDLGGGLITLPSSGWGLVPAVAAYVLV